jgi:hypothetical protein
MEELLEKAIEVKGELERHNYTLEQNFLIMQQKPNYRKRIFYDKYANIAMHSQEKLVLEQQKFKEIMNIMGNIEDLLKENRKYTEHVMGFINKSRISNLQQLSFEKVISHKLPYRGTPAEEVVKQYGVDVETSAEETAKQKLKHSNDTTGGSKKIRHSRVKKYTLRKRNLK